MNDLRKLPLHTYHLGNAARFTSFAGWQMPISYGSSLDEHMATRKEYSFFDVSHMGEIEVSGAEATDFLNFVITNDIRKCKDGQAIYSPLCYRNGGTVDDLIVYKVSHQNYLLCVNASNISKDLDFLEEHKGSFNCEVMDRSFHFSQLALQGPRSFELMSKFFGTRIVNIDKMHFKQFNLGDIPILLARTGYTGEDGFEIYVPEKKSPIWLLTLRKQMLLKNYLGLGLQQETAFDWKRVLLFMEMSCQKKFLLFKLDFLGR